MGEKKPSFISLAKKTPVKITGLSQTHRADNERVARLLQQAKAKAKFEPGNHANQDELERAFMVSATLETFREALKWLKLAGVDARAGRAKVGDRRYIQDAEAAMQALRDLKKKADQDLENQPTGIPESLLDLLERAQPYVDQLKP